VLDTVRKDYFDEHAPRLRDLADAEFDRCYASSSWSVPSHASILTGKLAHEHGVHSYNPDYATISETFLDELPHRRLGVSANGAVSETFGFDTLFDEFTGFAGNDERSPDAMSFKQVEDVPVPRRYLTYLSKAARRGKLGTSLRNGLYVKANDLLDGRPLPNLGDGGASAVVEKSRSMVEGAEPFFLFLNFIDAHAPFQNSRVLDSSVPYAWTSHELTDKEARQADPDDIADYLQKYRDLYAANVRYLDRTVADLIESLQASTERDTTVVVTADHGEELRYSGERDLGHMDFSTPTLHVPLTIVGGEASAEGERGLTSLLEVGSIVTRLAEGEPIPDISRERVPAERIGMMFYDGDDDYWTRGVRTVYGDDYRHEWDTLGTADRIEVGPSVDGDRTEEQPPPQVREEFATELDAYVATARESSATPTIDEATERRLEDLGYKM